MPKKIFFICYVLKLLCIMGMSQELVKEIALKENIPGCRVFSNVDVRGLLVYCKDFHANNISFLLPPSTAKLRIYWTYDLPANRPLVSSPIIVRSLELYENKLKSVTSRMFEGLTYLSTISLQDNFISSLPIDVFKHNLHLETVDLSNNFFFSMGGISKSLGHLKFLKHLDVSNNKEIRRISDQDFEPLRDAAALESLDVSDCNIEIIETNAFKLLSSLTSLNVSRTLLGNAALKNLSQSFDPKNLKDFRAIEMKHMSYFSTHFLRWLSGRGIKYLDISMNRFSGFPLGSSPELKVLNMIGCEINAMFYDTFTGMPELEILRLTPHSLTKIDKLFSKNVKLKILDLGELFGISNSETVEIMDYAFENLINLEILYLNKLPLKGQRLNRYLIHGLWNLQEVILYKDSIIYIEDFSFESLNSLLTLDLSFNSISDLSNCSFYGLQNVKFINLAHNKLSFLNSRNPFEYTLKLENLNLESNQILHFPIGIFSKLLSLQYVQASDNFIQPWNDYLVPRSYNLTAFLFSKNRITHFTSEMLEDLRLMEFVDFSQNPFNCSHCSTKNLQDWMLKTNVTIRILSQGILNYACDSPSLLKGVALMEADLNFLNLFCTTTEINLAIISYSFFLCLISIIVIITFIWHRWNWNIKYAVFLAQSRTRTYRDCLNSNRFKFDAFVSHCDSDKIWVRNYLLPSVETKEHKISLCLPDRNFIAGQLFIGNVCAAIEQSRTVILVLSNEYMDSHWCKFEAEVAQHKLFEDTRTGLILILLEPILKSKRTKNLQYIIKTRTCIQWTNNVTGQKLFWERLRQAIMNPSEKGLSSHIT